MDPTYFGAEQVTDEDRAYRGSRFSEIREAIFANPYQKVWGGPGEPPLPVYDVTLPNVLRGALPFGPPYHFRQAVARAVDFEGRSALGLRSQGFPADHSSQWNMPDRPLGNIRADALFRLFSNGELSAGGRALFHLLQGDAARPGTILVAGRQAVPDRRPRPPRAAPYRQLHYPARSRWRAD